MKTLIALLLFTIVTFFCSAQEIMLGVKKGTVIVNGVQTGSNSIPKKISKNTVIKSGNTATLLLKKGDKYLKIYCPCEHLTYADISKQFGKQAVSAKSNTEVLFARAIEHESGVQKGAVSRGTNDGQDFYINIEDSALIMNNAYFIEWKSPSKIQYNVEPQLVSMKTQQLIELGAVQGFEVSVLEPGWYKLYFEAATEIQGRKVNIKLTVPFYILSELEKNNIHDEVDLIKEGTLSLGEDIFEIYLTDYLQSRRITGY